MSADHLTRAELDKLRRRTGGNREDAPSYDELVEAFREAVRQRDEAEAKTFKGQAMSADLIERLRRQPEDIGSPSRMDMLREREEAAAEIERLTAAYTIAVSALPAGVLPVEPGPWTPELEKARIDLCHYWLDVAHDRREGNALPADLGQRAIETEQALTILGEFANATRVHQLLKASEHALRSYQYHNSSPELAQSIADEISAYRRDAGLTLDL